MRMVAGLGELSRLATQKLSPPTARRDELYVIALVVVGAPALRRQGRILGTLIGALIMAVIPNGMNLNGVESTTHKDGATALVFSARAALLEQLKKRSWKLASRLRE